MVKNKITIAKGEFALRLRMEDANGNIIKEEHFSTVGMSDEEVEAELLRLEKIAEELSSAH